MEKDNRPLKLLNEEEVRDQLHQFMFMDQSPIIPNLNKLHDPFYLQKLKDEQDYPVNGGKNIEYLFMKGDPPNPGVNKPSFCDDSIGSIISNAANLCRFTYALEDLNKDERIRLNKYPNPLNIKYKIDKNRDYLDNIHVKSMYGDDETIQKRFNCTLDHYKKGMIDQINLIHSYEVNGTGGTSYIASFEQTASVEGEEDEEQEEIEDVVEDDKKRKKNKNNKNRKSGKKHKNNTKKKKTNKMKSTSDGGKKVSKDVKVEKWLIVGFRGTHDLSEWKHTNFKLNRRKYKSLISGSGLHYKKGSEEWYKKLKVHTGFYNALRRITPLYPGNASKTKKKPKSKKQRILDKFKHPLKHSHEKEEVKEEVIEKSPYEIYGPVDSNKKIGPQDRYDIFKDVSKLLENDYKDYKLVVVGHSLGGALASLFGFEAQALGWNPTVITLAAPQVAYHSDHTEKSYLKHIYDHFNTSIEKYDHIKHGQLDHVFNAKKSYFINIVNTDDVVPVVPIVPYQKLGGIPIYTRRPYPSEIKSVDYYEKDSEFKHKQKTYLLPKDRDQILSLYLMNNKESKREPNELNLVRPTTFLTQEKWRLLRSYFNRGFFKFTDEFINHLRFTMNAVTTFTDYAFQFVFLVPKISDLYVAHVYYGLYYVSYEHDGRGTLNFPIEDEESTKLIN